MMASFMSYFGAGRKDPKETARDAIVGLRQQLQMIEKKEEYLQKKIDEEVKKAKANVVSNKAGEFPSCFQPRVYAALGPVLRLRLRLTQGCGCIAWPTKSSMLIYYSRIFALYINLFDYHRLLAPMTSTYMTGSTIRNDIQRLLLR